jgi:hypothetical protein
VRSVIVPLPWLRPPLSLNDRDHWAVKAKKTRAARSIAAAAITAAKIPPTEQAEVELHWRLPDWRHRDTDNPTATLKPCIDALVDCGVLPRDSWRHVTRSSCVFHPPSTEPAAMWLEVRAA